MTRPEDDDREHRERRFPPWAREARLERHEEHRRRRAWHHAHHAHRHAHHRAIVERWRRGPWRLMTRMRWRLFFIFAVALGIGAWLGHWHAVHGTGRGWIMLIAFVFLFMASGALAFKLTERFVAVVDTARKIGAGDLTARIEPGHHDTDLEDLAFAINDMAARIEKQLADQKQLLAAVSHELRTPLGHMRILLESARERGAEARTIDQLEREVIQLDDLVGRLLASSKLEFAHLERRPIDLAALVTEAATRAGVAASAIEPLVGDANADVDPTLVRRAVANLLENAAVHGGGVVAVRVTSDGDGELVRIEVDDAGPGVAPERRGEVFEPFVPSAAGGLGLGMALVARIAAAHGGRAWLDDRPGGGARAGVELPRHAPVNAA